VRTRGKGEASTGLGLETADVAFVEADDPRLTLFANAPAPVYLVVVGVRRGDAVIPPRFSPVTDPVNP
jgi:hypothetical protein